MKRIGIVGTGKMGISHFAIVNTTPGLKVVAVAETNILIAKVFSKYAKVSTYTDIDLMLEKESLDGVVICLPNKLHYDACCCAVSRRVNYFVEKPLTLNSDQSQVIVQKTKMAGIVGQVGYVNLYNPIFRKVKKIIVDKVLGEITHYQASMIGSVVTENSEITWRTNIAEGGGCLYDYGSHLINMLQFLFGPISDISTACLSSVYSKAAEDVVTATFIHDDGFCGQMLVNWCDPSQRKANNEITIWGSNGKLYANKQEIKVFLNKGCYEYLPGWNSIYCTDLSSNVPYYLRGEDFALQMMDFCRAISDQAYQLTGSVENAASVDIIIKRIREIDTSGDR
jgi:predicted dehydrogenase